MSAISQSTVAESPLATEPDAFTSYFAELVIGGTDVVTVRFALREFFTESAPLAISATPTTSNRHDYITDAVMYSAESGVAYEFNKLTPEQIAESPGIPVGPLSVNTIGDEQYIGYQNTHWNRDPAPLDIDVISQEIRVRGFISSAPLEIGLTGTAVYREAVRLNVVDNINLNLAVTELHYFFADADRTISPGIPVGPISVNTIAQEQFIGHQFIHWNRDPAPLDIDVISQEIRVRGFISSAPVELGATDISVYREAVRLNVVDTITLEVEFTELHYFFADADRTISPGIPVGPISVNTIAQEQFIGHQFNHWNRDPAPLDIDAVIVEKRIFNRSIDYAAIELDAIVDAYKRDAVRLNVTDPAVLVLGHSELNYYFPGPDPDRGVPLPIGPISIAAITELQYVSGEYGKTYTLEANVALVLNVEFTYTYPTQALATVEETVELLWFGESLPTVTHNIVSTTNLAVVNISSNVSTSINDNTVALAIGVTSDVSQKFVIDNTINLGIVEIHGVEYQTTLSDSIPLSLAVTDIVKRSILISDGVTVSTELAATSVVSNKFEISSNAVLAVVDIQSVEYSSITADTATLVIGATSTIEHIVLITDTSAALEVAATQQIARIDINSSTGSVLLADTSTAIFSANVDTNVALEIDAIGELNTFKIYEIDSTGELTLDSTAAFNRAFAYNTTGNLAVVDIVANETTSATDNTGVLAIAATTVIEQLFVFADTGNLAVVDIASTEIASNVDNTVELSISATSTISRVFAYADTGNLAVVDIVANETTSVTDNTVALAITATTDTATILAYSDSAAAELAATSTITRAAVVDTTVDTTVDATTVIVQKFVFDSSAVLALVDIVSNEIASNVDNDVVLALSSTAAVSKASVFDDTGNLAVVDIVANETTTATDNTGALEIATTEVLSATLVHDDTTAIEIAVTSESVKSITIVTAVDLTLEASDVIVQKFVFDDTGNLAVVDIVANETTSATDNTVALTISASSIDIQTYVFDDTGNLAVVDIVANETTSANDNTVALEIGATTVFSRAFAYADTGNLAVVDIVVETTTSAIDNTAVLTIAATTAIEQQFVFADTGNLAVVDIVSNSIASNVDNDVVLELSAISVAGQTFTFDSSAVLALVDIVSNEIASNVDNDVVLAIAVTDTVQQVFDYSTTAATSIAGLAVVGQTYKIDSTGNIALVDIQSIEYTANLQDSATATLSATESIEQRFDYVSTALLAIATEQALENTYAFADTGNVALVDIQSIEYITTIQDSATATLAATDAIVQSFVFVETAAAIIAVEQVLGQTSVFDDTGTIALVDIQSVEYTTTVQDSATATLSATEAIEQIFDFATTSDNEIAATALLGQTYVFDDAAVLAAVNITSIEYTANVEDSSFLGLAATAAIVQKFVFDSTAELAIDSYALSGLTYQFADTGNVALVDIQSVEYTSNVDNTVFWEFAVDAAFTQAFNFVNSTELVLTNMPVRSFLSLPATPFDYVKTNNGNDATVTLYGENRGDGLPGDVASLINALTNTMFFPGPGQQLFIDGSPFQYYGSITDVNVGQLQDGSYEITISLTDAASGPAPGSLVTGTGIQFDNTFVTEFGITQIFNLGEESVPIEVDSVVANEITSNVVTDAIAEITTGETIAQIFNYVDTSNNEIAATALFGQTYIFDDSANLAVVDIVSNELTSNVENTSFFEFVASDTVEQIFNYVETAAAEIAATAEVAVIFAFDSTVETVLEDQSTNSTVLSYADTGNLAVVDIVANEITSNVESATFFDLVAEQAIEQKFNFVETADILIGDQNTNTTSLNYVDETNMAVVNIQSVSVKYNIEDIPFFTYDIDTAIEQKFNFVETAAAALGADVATSMTMAVSNVTAVDLLAEASNTIVSNVVEDPQLDIAADYITQSSRSDVVEAYFADFDAVDNVGITKLVYAVDHIGDIMGYSFAKGYTLFKQEYSNEPTSLTLGAVSGEIQVITGGSTASGSKQIWIG